MTDTLTRADETTLLAAIEAARRSREHGNHPFGAVLANPAGQIILEAQNTVTTNRDATGHAETNLVRLASQRFDRSYLLACSLYTSTEPCAMCSGAIYWAGIGRVVYGLGEDDLLEITGHHPDNPTMSLPCREVFARGQRPTEVVGPALTEQARAVHADFWNQ